MIKLLLALALVACSSGPKTTTPPVGGGSDTPPPSGESHSSCTTNEDCVVVETACCDHCNGGKAEAFNKAHAEAHKPPGCQDIACTEMACGPAIASCEAGTCKVTIGKLE
jgi:hypothetical protein